MKTRETRHHPNGILWLRIFLLGLAGGLALITFATAHPAPSGARNDKIPTASNFLAEKG